MAIVNAIAMSEAASPEAAFLIPLNAEGPTPSPGDIPSLAAPRRLPFTRADRLSNPLAARRGALRPRADGMGRGPGWSQHPPESGKEGLRHS